MTLPSVFVDLSHVFAEGQVYTALSRCSTMTGLKVRYGEGFLDKEIKAHRHAVVFYNKLSLH
jgi:ATP-dependent exoDNAse (exonuclease V) alpha subunit